MRGTCHTCGSSFLVPETGLYKKCSSLLPVISKTLFICNDYLRLACQQSCNQDKYLLISARSKDFLYLKIYCLTNTRELSMLNIKERTIGILLIFLAGCSTLHEFEKIITPEEQVDIEKDLAIPKYNNPLKFDIAQLGFKNENIKTLEELNKKYPNYGWNTYTYNLTFDFFQDDPDRPGESARYYYKGVENAKRIAYRSVLTKENINNLKNEYFGQKVVIYDIDDENSAQYSCGSVKRKTPLALLMVPVVGEIASVTADGIHDNDIKNNQAYWNCSATVRVRLFSGQHIPWK